MSKRTKKRFHPEVRTIDLPEIAKKFKDDPSGFRECQQMIDKAIARIQLFPEREGKLCEYEPLSSAHFRKVKVFSKKCPEKGETPDLRIIYRYVEQEDAVDILTIGFRKKGRPRPPEDPCSLSANRSDEFI